MNFLMNARQIAKKYRSKIIMTALILFGVPSCAVIIGSSVGVEPKDFALIAISVILGLIPAIILALWRKEVRRIYFDGEEKTPQNHSNVDAHLDSLNVIYQKLAEMKLEETDDDYEWVREIPAELNSNEFVNILSIEKDLNRALGHLQQKRPDIYDAWNELELAIQKYNDNIPKFIKFLKNHIHKTMTKTNYAEFDWEKDGYNLVIMRRAVMVLIDEHLEYGLGEHIPELKIEGSEIRFDCDKFKDFIFFIINGKPQKIKDDLTKILLEIATDKTILQKYRPYDRMRSDMLMAHNGFEQLIEPLADDIRKHGLRLEGKCDLGY